MSTVATTRASLTQHALSSSRSSSSPPPSVVTVTSSVPASPTTPPPPLQAPNLLSSHSHSHAPLFEQLYALRRQRVDMHPDCMLLQAHGVTSPRLSPSAAALTAAKSRRPSAPMEASAAAEEPEEDICEAVDSADEMDVVGDNDDDDDEGDMRSQAISELEAKATATRLVGTTPHGGVEVEAGEDVEEDDDALSLCSEDSELSVGQEGGSAANSGCHTAPSFCDFNQQRRLLLSNVGNMMALCAPSAFSSVHAPGASAYGGDGSDARSSASTDDNTIQQLDDESVGSGTGLTLQPQQAPPPLQPGTAMLDPYVVASALRMPVPMVPRAAPTHAASFQTEFMRKSHMYAEELVKQQMQFMAAARASAFTLRGTSTVESAAAAERRAFARVQGASQQMSNLASIQSQLTAITKMSQLSAAAAAAAVAVAAVANNNQPAQHSQHPQLQQNKSNFPNNADALSKLSALTTAHTHLSPTSASAAVSSLSQLQAQMQAHFPYAHSNHANNNLNNNNNLNEPALKFSIDNILKADFGRRLAEGAACMAACNSSSRATKTYGGGNSTSALLRARKAAAASSVNAAAAASSASAGANATNSAIAIDLTHLSASSTATTTTSSTATLNFSHTLANICTNSSDSNSTAVSSSYGGAASEHAKSPGAAGAANGDFSAAAAKCAATSTEESNGGGSSSSAVKSSGTGASGSGPIVWPAWVYCTRYSDRPSSGT
ncbi:PREDICTED: mucin-19-like [Rhagoletis zephyria]|uniref:mucin-19-like n=1 Tax=Rhagoletis zephyria TaxID=28612 RepID=UPI0008117F1D|nr:PREDICTED: mucin-19-like [Rhagoletis zephyria]